MLWIIEVDAWLGDVILQLIVVLIGALRGYATAFTQNCGRWRLQSVQVLILFLAQYEVSLVLLPRCDRTIHCFDLLRVSMYEACTSGAALDWICKTAFTSDLDFWASIAIGRIICIIECLFCHLIFQRGAIDWSQLLTHALTSTPGTLLYSVCNRTLEWV